MAAAAGLVRCFSFVAQICIEIDKSSAGNVLTLVIRACSRRIHQIAAAIPYLQFI